MASPSKVTSGNENARVIVDIGGQ
ncbi:MAG: hypothetical protein QOI17_1067, partial [Gaiellales bacterium]|nr:hypothetical protein [Gaiellales bacterium]